MLIDNLTDKRAQRQVTSVYEFSDFCNRTRWVYQCLRCSKSTKAGGTVVDNLEQQVVMVLVYTAAAD